ncbi:hypothetical protein BKA69DRAFT_1167039 [Paraphysoderma sedebokerense]|nr:hypothetical protein BKA69DRAFT_1168999 [Paraphysoderma sedebokerense]KAI9141169.1 hypothetical protein BKA69DRAFT_1167039 [Paraphysoderma sedebokerense]
MEKGLEAQGIFRISLMKNEVEAMVHNYRTADTVEFTNDVNEYSVVDAFKLFLTRLQSPVIPAKCIGGSIFVNQVFHVVFHAKDNSKDALRFNSLLDNLIRAHF